MEPTSQLQLKGKSSNPHEKNGLGTQLSFNGRIY